MASTTSSKREAIDYSYDVSEEDEGEVYVPLKRRREEQLKRLTAGKGRLSRSETPETSRKEAEELQRQQALTQEEVEEEERARKRIERTLLSEAQEVKARKAAEGA